MTAAKKKALDLDHEVDTYPAVIRRRIMRCWRDVEKLAGNEGLEADVPRLSGQYRSSRSTMTGATLPFSLKLWVALDRLEQAYADRFRFDPTEYDSGPVSRAVLDRLHGKLASELPDVALRRKVTARKLSRYAVKLLMKAEEATDHLSQSDVDEALELIARRQAEREAARVAESTPAKMLEGMSWDDCASPKIAAKRINEKRVSEKPTEYELAMLAFARNLAWTELHAAEELLSAWVDSAVGSARRAGPANALSDGANSKTHEKHRQIWQYLVVSGLHNWKRGEGKGHKKDAEGLFKVKKRTVDSVIAAGKKGAFGDGP